MPVENEVPGTEPAVESGNTDALGGTIPAPVTENPAWSTQLDKFPDSVKHIAREAFSEWDKDVQTRFTGIQEKYKPYQAYVDQNIDPQKLESAWGLAQLLESDPTGFTQLLAQQLGMTIQQAEEAVEDLQAEAGGEVDPTIAAMQQQITELTDFITGQQQQQQQSQLAQQQEQQIDQEFAALEGTHGKLQPEIKNQILKEMLRLSFESNQPVTVQQAYDSVESFARIVRQQPRPGQLAPRVMPSGGAVPVTKPEKSLGQLSPKETKQYVADLLTQQLASQ